MINGDDDDIINSVCSITPWRHKANTWTNIDLLSVRSCGIHLAALS